jgi:hypothetical protein
MNTWLFLIPLFTAFTGWIVTWLTIKMIFLSRTISFAGVRIQPLFEKIQPRISTEIVSFAASRFGSLDEWALEMDERSVLDKLRPELEAHIDQFLTVKLKESMPVIGMLIGERTTRQLKEIFMKELEELFPLVMRKAASHMLSDVNIGQIISEKLSGIPPASIQEAFVPVLAPQLRRAQLFSLLIGLVIGAMELLLIIIIKR